MLSALLFVVVISKYCDAVVIRVMEKHISYEALHDIMLLLTQANNIKLVDNADVPAILSTA
eukprot:4798649-Ditylum_brightwellii.AAC.1